MQNTQGIIKRPIITEKATMASETMNRFTFEVMLSANFGGGKASLKYTNRGIVREKAKKWKKAIVSVAEGETIDLFNNY